MNRGLDYYKKKIGIPLAILVLLGILAVPMESETLGMEGHRCLALFGFAFVLYLTEAIQTPIVSLMIPPMATLMGVASIKVSLGGFSSSSTYLIVGSFILAAAMLKSKFANRITYLILLKVGTSATKVTLGIMIANIVLAFLVPSSTARTAIMLPICLSIIQQFKGEKKGRTNLGANILLTLCFTNATISGGILTATVPNPVTVQFLAESTGEVISYMRWLKLGFLPALIMTIITWALIQLLMKPEVKELTGGKAFVKHEMEQLGKMSPNEIRCMIIFGITVVLWVFGEQLHVDSTTACLAGACLLCIPRLGFLNWKDCKENIGWNVLFIAGGGISLGSMMKTSGAADYIANSIFHGLNLGQMGPVAMVLLMLVVVQFMHVFFVGTTVMANAFIPIVLSIAMTAGINPPLLVVPAGILIGAYPLLFFYCTNPNILAYGTEEVAFNDFPKVGIPVCIIACIVYALCVVFVWPATGLLV